MPVDANVYRKDWDIKKNKNFLISNEVNFKRTKGF